MSIRVSNDIRPNLPQSAENEKTPPKSEKKWKETLGKIWNVVSKILLAVANIVMFLTNPTLYTIAFFVGVVWNKQTQLVIDKIIIIWKKQPWAMAAVTGVAGFLSLQVAWAAASVIFAAHLGATLSQKAQDLLDEEAKKNKKPQEPIDFKLV